LRITDVPNFCCCSSSSFITTLLATLTIKRCICVQRDREREKRGSARYIKRAWGVTKSCGESVCFWVFRRRKVDDTVISRISCDYSAPFSRPQKNAIPVEVLITGKLTMWTTRNAVVTRRRHLMYDFDRLFLCAKQLWRMLARALSANVEIRSLRTTPKTKKGDQIPKNASPI